MSNTSAWHNRPAAKDWRRQNEKGKFKTNTEASPEPTNVDERRAASDPDLDPVAEARKTHEQAVGAATEAAHGRQAAEPPKSAAP